MAVDEELLSRVFGPAPDHPAPLPVFGPRPLPAPPAMHQRLEVVRPVPWTWPLVRGVFAAIASTITHPRRTQ